MSGDERRPVGARPFSDGVDNIESSREKSHPFTWFFTGSGSGADVVSTEKSMANTYTRIEIHAVFAVKFRKALLSDEWRADLHQYMIGILRGQGCPVLQINSVEDHVHVLFELNPNKSCSEVLRELKSESSRWINAQRKTHDTFRWQEGYGAFSVSHRAVSTVCGYIANQQQHHRRKRFAEEVKTLYGEVEMEYNPAYLFRDPE